MTEYRIGERQACRLLELDRTSYRYEARPDRNAGLRQALLELARQKPRYGYRRLWAVLTRQGWAVNVKRIYRLYREEGLMVRRLKRKRLVRGAPVNAHLTAVNQEWALDFVCDATATGRGLRILTVVDSFTRECPAIEVNTGLSGQRVTRVLEQIIAERGKRKRSGATTGRSSPAATSSRGVRNRESRCCTFSRGGRCRTAMWRVSTGGCATNA